ncbi:MULTISPECIES: CBS domain-containing protein [Alcanivorax]|nr:MULTISPECIES: CBS domain-containing protein [Alcanivorax]
MKVTDYMKRGPLTLDPGVSLFRAMELLLENRISGAPVVERGVLVGMFSESDSLRGMLEARYHGIEIGVVADYMSREPQVLPARATVLEAMEVFLRHHRRRLPVVENGKLVGQISRHDILRAMLEMAAEDGIVSEA